MLQSKLLTKASKTAKEYDSVNATLLQKGGYVDQLMAGVYSYLPLGYRVLRKVENIVREEMIALGAEEILMPVLHPKDNWERTGRWDSLDVLFRLKGAGEKDMALGPTHEEIVTPLTQNFIQSYQDLPKAVFQIQTKFRNEARSKSGILRGREFLMKDLYSFHADESDLDEYYKRTEKAYERIWQRLGIGDITLKTYASGGSFSKYSHEYQTLSEVGEDTIYVCEKCQMAVNKEIIEEQNTCPQCGSSDLAEKQSIEVGNIFKLKNKYSDAFNFTFKDRAGENKPVLMSCFGIGVSRVMGVIVEVFNDGKGIFWPEAVAPYAVHLIGLNLEDEEVKKNAWAKYEELKAAGTDVLFDDREDVGAGEKFAEADLIGCPTRMIISKRSGPEPEVQSFGKK